MKRLTEAKVQRAIAAVVAVMETGALRGDQALLDRACDVMRDALREQAER